VTAGVSARGKVTATVNYKSRVFGIGAARVEACAGADSPFEWTATTLRETGFEVKRRSKIALCLNTYRR